MAEDLPILDVVPQIKAQLIKGNTLILQAPPGAGKSTLLPLELLNESWLKDKKVLMLEPRRLAARSVAARMASLLEEEVGKTVGYKVRFENKTSRTTKLEVLTEGILTRMLQEDNALEGIGLVIFDEFHERSLHADLALALCREIQQVLRDDLRILIMSATLDGEALSRLLGNAPIVSSQGRQFPISHIYLGNDPQTHIAIRVVSAIKRALQEQKGDILVFLPGTGEIHKVTELIGNQLPNEAELFPLYGDLSFKEQQAAILPHPQGRRKVVLATSIAETSLTIEGVKTVIDSGLSRVPKFNPNSGLTKLETERVTLDAADQRAGRAGRLGPGVCYRLWSEGTHQHLVAHKTPEITEADLAPMTLELANWGVVDPRSLSWLTFPPTGAISQAKQLLQELEALDELGRITERGKQMLQLPTHPRIAHLLLEGERLHLGALASDVASVLEERDPLPKEKSTNLAIRVEALRKWRGKEYTSAERNVLERIERLASNWRRLLRCETDNAMPHYEKIGLLISAAYPERIARQKEGDISRYRLANGRVVKLPDNDELDREKWLALAHLDAGSSEGKIYLAAPLNPDDLTHLLRKAETIRWDAYKGILLAQTEWRLGDIVVKTSPLEKVDEVKKAKIVCEVVRKEGLSLFDWTDSAKQLQARMQSICQWRQELDMPSMSDGQLLTDAEEWLAPYISPIRKREDFQRLPLEEILQSFMTWEQSTLLDKLAPEKIEVPSGFQIPLQYFNDGRDPVLAVRLQEMFGLLETPTINEGRTKVLLHLLSPGYKPVQVTQDLKSFWQNTYPEVRKELRIRYQKHSWPEDPWTAEAVRGVKKRN